MMPGLTAKNTKPRRPPSRQPSPAMHAGQCAICRHPQRAEIEGAFLDWRGPREIAREYDLGSYASVYRHAHALGLFERRQRTVRFALGRLIEHVGEVKPTAASIVSAIRLMVKLNAADKRVEESETLVAQGSRDAEALERAEKSSAENAPIRVARGAAPVSNGPAQFVPAADQSASTKTKGDRDDTSNPPSDLASEDGSNGPPIPFAQNAGPRRKFLWR